MHKNISNLLLNKNVGIDDTEYSIREAYSFYNNDEDNLNNSKINNESHWNKKEEQEETTAITVEDLLKVDYKKYFFEQSIFKKKSNK